MKQLVILNMEKTEVLSTFFEEYHFDVLQDANLTVSLFASSNYELNPTQIEEFQVRLESLIDYLLKVKEVVGDGVKPPSLSSLFYKDSSFTVNTRNRFGLRLKSLISIFNFFERTKGASLIVIDTSNGEPEWVRKIVLNNSHSPS